MVSLALAMASPAAGVSRPTDPPDELEAERVADRLSGGFHGRDATPCTACADDRRVQRAASSAGAGPSRADGLLTGGRALDAGAKAWFEPRLGASLEHVRIHTDEAAAGAARHLGARAFTTGSHIGFGHGEYTPGTAEGHRLLAHELAHVVQQSPARGAAGAPVIQRTPEEGAGSGGPAGFDPAKARETALSELDDLISNGDHQDAAFAGRLKLLLQASEPDWPDKAAFERFYKECSGTAQDEKATIDALGDPDRTDPEAFPATWSARLGKHLTMSYPVYLLQRDVDAAHLEMQKSGADIPGEIVEHGLPVGFAASLDLRAFQLSNVLGAAFLWTITPAGTVFVQSGPLATFATHALRYLHAINEADSVELWIRGAEGVVKQVEDGELSVDPEAFDAYERLRPVGVSWDVIKGSQLTLGEPLKGRVDPAAAERSVTSGAALLTFGRSFQHAEDVTAMAGRLIGQADSSITAEPPVMRQMRASNWGHQKGFYLAAVEHELEDIKEHAVEIGVGMARDVALFTAIQFIPVVNVIADIYMGVQLVSDVLDTLDELESAEQMARDAKSAAALQRAAAHQASALSSTARKVAMAVAMHHAMKAAGGVTGAHDPAGKAGDVAAERARPSQDPAKTQGRAEGGPADRPSEPARVPDSPEKIQERARQEHEKAEKQARESEREPKPGELNEDLPKGGSARVTAEGHCKICHSPCRFQVEMAETLLKEVQGTRAAGYAENLATRIRLLDDAMELAASRGTLKAEYRSRFAAAHQKLAAEIDGAYRMFVDDIQGGRHAAGEEIQSWEAEREQGMMDDPNRWRRSPERAREGTAFHDHVEAAVVDALPAGTVYTENTVQGLFRSMGVDPAKFPEGSTGIDLYVIDSVRGVVTPVDITSVAGGKAHVRKLHKNAADVRDAFEQVGLHMTEPIEIEYIGMTFKQAAASIAAELRAYARPPKGVSPTP